jgi:hypothetical protein
VIPWLNLSRSGLAWRRNLDHETKSPQVRALTAHITLSVGWLGAVASFLALAVVCLTSHDAQLLRGLYLAMGV